MFAELHPDADQEFTEHALYYERRDPGLGGRFLDEIERGIEMLISQPQIGSEFYEEF